MPAEGSYSLKHICQEWRNMKLETIHGLVECSCIVAFNCYWARVYRSGEEVHVEPRPVTCHSARCTQFSPPYFTLQVHCGSGFYIRSLVHQLGLSE
ncbi:hypothetical protein PR048_031080 [Dryococelus australis]|uniref:tRNA pseudouridine(55) synthase n=1 Tax=Dryococelus australis TaxID=614101 RepID=A0ABQ9G732_9NEOP|nr:hypothetical protein PR048_031080 [Dryococelus australis]